VAGTSLTGKAYAKVNLHLEVKSKRPDGYHDLVSLFHAIDLHDDISVTVKPAQVFDCRIEGMADVDLTANTMYKAALGYCTAVGHPLDVSISIRKRIPMEAGLGGGSSDAACVLHLLNHLDGSPLSMQRLLGVAAHIGSDVPFFTTRLAAAVVTGRGEHVQGIEARDDLCCLVAVPHGYRVSTKAAFERLDRARTGDKKDASRASLAVSELEPMYRHSCATWQFFNDFQALADDPEGHYRTYGQQVGCTPDCFGTLSGSGSAYVMFSTRRDVLDQLACSILKDDNKNTLFLTKCLHAGDIDANLLVIR
jgi:4-diphosphocytidyl-2-C-methyl-D-erythritol kinase